MVQGCFPTILLSSAFCVLGIVCNKKPLFGFGVKQGFFLGVVLATLEGLSDVLVGVLGEQGEGAVGGVRVVCHLTPH